MWTSLIIMQQQTTPLHSPSKQSVTMIFAKKPKDSETTLTLDEILVLKKFAGFLSGGDFPGMDQFVTLVRTRGTLMLFSPTLTPVAEYF